MKQLTNRKDIELLVTEFYKKATKDDVIGFFFTDVVQLDLQSHLPVMFDFWESTILGTSSYQGNPMEKHLSLSKIEPMKPAHFERWISLWEETVRLHFEGQKAEEIIQRAKHIAALMSYKVQA